MAVTSIWPIKGRVDRVINYARNPEKTTEGSYEELASLHAVDNVVEYAANDMKTERRSYVSCLNCRENSAATQFVETKRLWGKLGGRVCYHGYQSFQAGEVTAETAHEIGVKLARELWGDRFEVVVATHCNTGHYHNHFVINSVSLMDALPPDKRENSAAFTGLKYCNKLFAWEERFKNLSPEERTKQRLKEEKPILDALLAWADSIPAAPKSALGKALHYLKQQRPYLLRYLEDGRLELSNNRAERSIKPFVIGRKNFLFANTPLGAQASAVIYSLIETAKETGLDPFRYLVWLLKTAPTLDRTMDSWATTLLPAYAPDVCRTPLRTN